MKMPDSMTTYCPFCKKHTVHKIKMYKKGSVRSLARGQRRHELKGKGYTSKIAGKVPVYKQAKHPTLVLTCTICKKKHPKTVGSRTRKALELTKKEE
jgi:large subunit ribosomal protein L44e